MGSKICIESVMVVAKKTEEKNDELCLNIDDSPQLEEDRENLVRREEPWTDTTEELAQQYMADAQVRSKSHEAMAKVFKKRHIIFGLPAILIPTLFTPFSTIFADQPGFEYANAGAYLTTAILTTVHNFFGFAFKYQKHMDYSARYADVVSDIQYEIAKGRKYRTPADQFLMRMQMKVDFLGATAPDL